MILILNKSHNEIATDRLVASKSYCKSRKLAKQSNGTIHGKVKDIRVLPNEDGCRVKIELPNGLKTSYDKEIQIRPSLKANV